MRGLFISVVCKMKNLLIFLEPFERPKTSKFLILVNRILEILEWSFLLYPRIEYLSRYYKICVVTSDYELYTKLRRLNIECVLILPRFDSKTLEEIKKVALSILESIHNEYGGEFSYLNVDLLKSMDQELLLIIFNALKQLYLYAKYIARYHPQGILVSHPSLLLTDLLYNMSREMDVFTENIYPKYYSKIRRNILDLLFERVYEKSALNSIHLYLLHFDEGASRKSQRRILLNVPYGNYFDVVRPMITKCFSKKGYEVYVISKRILLKKLPLEAFRIRLSKVGTYNRDMKGILKMKKSFTVPFYFHFFGVKISIQPSILQREVIKKRIPILLKHLNWFAKIVKKVKPDLMIVGDDRGPAFVRADVYYCKSHGVSTMEIQHGVYLPTQPFATPISDILCVWGDYTRSLLRKSGAQREQIVITGSPKHKEVAIRVSSDRKHNKKVVFLFATQPAYYALNVQIIKTFEKILDKRDDVELYVKPHPSEKLSLYRRIISRHSNGVYVVNEDISDLLEKVDYLIVVSSTVGFDAVIQDVPILLIDIEGKQNPFWPISILVKDLTALPKIIDEVIDDGDSRSKISLSSREKFIKKHVYRQGDEAIESICDIIGKALN